MMNDEWFMSSAGSLTESRLTLLAAGISFARHQSRKLGGVLELLEPQHRGAQPRDLRRRQRFARELFEFIHDFGVGGEFLLAPAGGLHRALQHRAVVETRLDVDQVAVLRAFRG